MFPKVKGNEYFCEQKKDMKRIFFCIITLLVGIGYTRAQSNVSADTLRSASVRGENSVRSETSVRGETSPDGTPLSDKELLPDVKNYDGFLLDMGLMNLSAPTLPKFTLEIPDASKDYSRIFWLNPNVTYSQGLSNIFSLSNSRYFSSNPFGLTGFRGATDNLQMGSFTLKNGMRIHTYGEYDKDGWKVPNPSALPWEKNNFKGAFELKSANGAFGIRIEVQQGRHVPY